MTHTSVRTRAQYAAIHQADEIRRLKELAETGTAYADIAAGKLLEDMTGSYAGLEAIRQAAQYHLSGHPRKTAAARLQAQRAAIGEILRAFLEPEAFLASPLPSDLKAGYIFTMRVRRAIETRHWWVVWAALLGVEPMRDNRLPTGHFPATGLQAKTKAS